MRKLGTNERRDHSYRLVVGDHVGVLNRITGYIRRNGWNIRRMRVEPLEQGGQTEIWMQLPLIFRFFFIKFNAISSLLPKTLCILSRNILCSIAIVCPAVQSVRYGSIFPKKHNRKRAFLRRLFSSENPIIAFESHRLSYSSCARHTSADRCRA